ncbi:MAG: hypothetical protein IJW92_03855 [Clostridia bacterium]|nr:hypothetical protein [Clostridia bacterium]
MGKGNQKAMIIILGSVGGAAAVGAVALSLWNSKQFRAMRAMRRTNAVLHRVGSMLCKISEATGECM